jgi:hypothetical protein
MSRLTLTPSYGRDYKSKAEVIAAWNAGKDFTVSDMSGSWDGSQINLADAIAGGITTVNIRYKRLTQVAVIKVVANPKPATATVFADNQPSAR